MCHRRRHVSRRRVRRRTTEVAIVVDGHEHREPIGDDGLVSVITRIRADEPGVIAYTRDGRAVTAIH